MSTLPTWSLRSDAADCNQSLPGWWQARCMPARNAEAKGPGKNTAGIYVVKIQESRKHACINLQRCPFNCIDAECAPRLVRLELQNRLENCLRLGQDRVLK